MEHDAIRPDARKKRRGLSAFSLAVEQKLSILAAAAALLGLCWFAVWESGLPDKTAPAFAPEDLHSAWDADAVCNVSLTERKSDMNSDVYFENGEFLFLRQGAYLVSGTLSDGALVVHAGKADTVRLILSGAALRCEDNAAIRVEQAGKVILTLAPGTENSVSCGADFSKRALAEKWSGAVCSKGDLTVNGGGALAVSADYGHGLVSDGSLSVTGGDITILSAADGLHARESVKIAEGDAKTRLRITANTEKGCQGIEANALNGSILVAGGAVSILQS